MEAPDIFDLEAWAREHAPELDQATRYLHAGPRRDALLVAWNARKSPANRRAEGAA